MPSASKGSKALTLQDKIQNSSSGFDSYGKVFVDSSVFFTISLILKKKVKKILQSSLHLKVSGRGVSENHCGEGNLHNHCSAPILSFGAFYETILAYN